MAKSKTPSPATNDLFRALAHNRRRAIVELLVRMSHAQPEELATHIVAKAEGKTVMDVTRPEAERVLVDLEQVHLPMLEAAGLVTRTDGVVTTTEHPVYQDPKLQAIIENATPNWDQVLESLADKRRRVILTSLYRNEGTMDRTDLAVEVSNKVQNDAETSVAIEEVLWEIHHRHVPKLVEAGLVRYNTAEGTVTYKGHPDLDEEWLVAGVNDTPRAILSSANQSADIWTLEGRDNVTERGRALCDSAEEELFMMFTVEGTVETACVRRIQDAIDRGVDVYLGTQNKELRDLVREHAPEVTIWEPQLDWLNLPPNREKVGRLILADREEIMIGTIGDEGSDGIPLETAVTGAGEDNPLVMLLREMLGSRLDHLDAQSDDFRSQIPL